MGVDVELPAGLATFVAPLPCADPLEAARLAVHAAPQLPTVPELAGPPGAAMARALAPVAGCTLDAAASARDAAEDPTLRHVLELLAPGTVGLRVEQIGPVTLTLALRRAGLDAPIADALARRCVTARVDAVLDVVRSALPSGVVVVVLREPSLVGAMHPTFPLGPHEVHGLLAGVVGDIDRHRSSGGLVIGAHVAGPTDWSTIIASGVSLLSVPVTGAGPRAELVADFVGRGGRIAWGAVPVDRPLGTHDELLRRALFARWGLLVDAGTDGVALARQSLVSTADGLEAFGASQARRALELVGTLASRVQRATPRPVGV